MNTNKITHCPSCGREIEPDQLPFLMTPADVKKCIHSDRICEDVEYVKNIARYGGIHPDELDKKQVVFMPDEADKYDFIQMKHGEFFYQSQIYPMPILSRACPNCHTNLTELLKNEEIRPVILIGDTSASKTCCVASCCALLDAHPLKGKDKDKKHPGRSDTITSGFAVGSFEEKYYSKMAAALNAPIPHVVGPTMSDKHKSKRQPLSFFRAAIGGKTVLLMLIDHPGESFKRDMVTMLSGSIVVLMVDGSRDLSSQLSFLLHQARSFADYASRFVIAVTKCDRLPQDAVSSLMLTEYEKQNTFCSFADLAAARRRIMEEHLEDRSPSLYNLYTQISNLGILTDFLFIAALGTDTDPETNALKGPYKPQYMYDFLLTLADR